MENKVGKFPIVQDWGAPCSSSFGMLPSVQGWDASYSSRLLTNCRVGLRYVLREPSTQQEKGV